MATNHAETSILIDGVDTRNMSDDLLMRQIVSLKSLLSIPCVQNSPCEHCELRTVQLDIATAEAAARRLTGQAVITLERVYA